MNFIELDGLTLRYELSGKGDRTLVLVHEMGHAFQDWKSRKLPAYDYLTPTYESAEIHSMSIEYLSAPFLEQFFGSDAARYRRQQLEDALEYDRTHGPGR